MVERNINIQIDHSCNPLDLSVKLIFDIYTPRPHFVIVQREEYRKSNATEKEINDTIQLVTQFLLNNPKYDNNAILSFHCGKWYQQHEKLFHAHLCVPKKPYCKEAQVMITAETSKNYWLDSKEYLKQLHEDFLLSKIKYCEYRDRCLSMAHKCLNDPVSYCVPLQQFNTSKFTLVFLASTPRIGILAKHTNIELKVLYNFLHKFYFLAEKKLSLINPLFENFGVHLCLYVKGKEKKNPTLTKRCDQVLVAQKNPIKAISIVGYIQMDEQLYLRWLPACFHSIWLNEFQKYDHLVST